MQIINDVYHPFVEESTVPGPTLMISAGVHGDEYEPMLACHQLIELISGRIKKGKLVIVPLTNISAYKATSRYGEDGLDLARICPGKEDGTPSERAAAAVSKLIREADYFIDLHTGGRVLNIFPLSGYMLHNEKGVLEKQRWLANAFGLPVVWGTDSALEGRTLSVARDVNCPAIYVEYGGGDVFKPIIVEAYLKGCINILAGLDMINESYVDHQPVYEVEDYTPNNGHLQSKMPALSDGIFVPMVNPGDFVDKGDLWGKIVDLTEKKEMEVRAEEKGMVLFLRSTSFVLKNDALGGILPISQPGKIKIQ
jgi:predicted deacylase